MYSRTTGLVSSVIVLHILEWILWKPFCKRHTHIWYDPMNEPIPNCAPNRLNLGGVVKWIYKLGTKAVCVYYSLFNKTFRNPKSQQHGSVDRLRAHYHPGHLFQDRLRVCRSPGTDKVHLCKYVLSDPKKYFNKWLEKTSGINNYKYFF